MWFFAGGTLLDTIGSTLSVLISFAGAVLGLDCLGAVYSAYRRASKRLEDERWLLDNCKDPVFFSKMKAHPSVCSEVETNARIGAFWTALKEVTDGARVSWQPYITVCAVATVVLLPICWVCAARVSSRCSVRRRRREWGQCIPLHDDFGPVCKARD
jgi:hypothetical protein